MVDVILEFFGLIDLEYLPPANMAELIPYLPHFFVGVVLVAAVFRIIGSIGYVFINFRHFR